MAASPAPSSEGSYCRKYSSSRESTPQPGASCAFEPIDPPQADRRQLTSAQLAAPDPVGGRYRSEPEAAIGRSEIRYAPVAPTEGGGRFAVSEANIAGPQITWSTGSDGMSFTFRGASTPMTSTSECSYECGSSGNDDADDGLSSACSDGSSRSKSKPKPKRRRIITKDQRRAANQRERRRMVTLNDAFDMLKQRIPTFTHEKKLSRIETLRLAISYISFMGQLVDGKHPSDVTVGIPYAQSDGSQSAHAVPPDVMENYAYVMPDAMTADSMTTMDAAAYVMDMNQHHQHGYYMNDGYMTQ